MSSKEKALEKMLEEMSKKHTGAEDAIHNWLCDQEDEALFKGIIKKDKNINGAMKYCTSQAAKQKEGNVAMVDAQTVFGWVYKYFTTKTMAKNSSRMHATVKAVPPAKRKHKKDKVNSSEGVEQLSLLDML